MNREEILLKTKAMNVLWIAFIIASLAYIFISIYILKNPLTEIKFSVLTTTILVIGFFNIFLGMSLYKRSKYLLLQGQSKQLEYLLSRLFTINLIAWALIESAAALGLILSILESNTSYITILAIPAIIAIYLSPPRPEILKEILR